MHGKCTLFFKKNLTFYARFLKIPMHVFHGIKSGIDVHVMPKNFLQFLVCGKLAIEITSYERQ
jgi:hypothetical protein